MEFQITPIFHKKIQNVFRVEADPATFWRMYMKQ